MGRKYNEEDERTPCLGSRRIPIKANNPPAPIVLLEVLVRYPAPTPPPLLPARFPAACAFSSVTAVAISAKMIADRERERECERIYSLVFPCEIQSS